MKIELAPIQRENIPARIYREIKRKLMMGQLRPGEAITLRSVSESLEVSQTPVREALLQLVSERALTLSPGKSIMVPILTTEQLQELRDIRLEMESFATARATAIIEKQTIRELARIQKALIVGRKQQDVNKVLQHNFEFHFTLYGAARMPYLVSVIENLWVQTASYLTYMYRTPFPKLSGTHPHQDIINALKERDDERAVKAVRRDIEGHGQVLMGILKEHGLIK